MKGIAVLSKLYMCMYVQISCIFEGLVVVGLATVTQLTGCFCGQLLVQIAAKLHQSGS